MIAGSARSAIAEDRFPPGVGPGTAAVPWDLHGAHADQEYNL